MVTPKRERANVVLVGPIPEEEMQEESLKQKSQKFITIHWMLMILVKYQMVEETFYLVVVRPLAVNGQHVAFEKFEPTRLDIDERGLVTFQECKSAYLKHAYDMKIGFFPCSVKKHVINSFSKHHDKSHSWRSGVAVECGSSHCTFDIKVYEAKLSE